MRTRPLLSLLLNCLLINLATWQQLGHCVNGQAANPYFDGLSDGRPAGLGVCSTGFVDDFQCDTPSDDNLQPFAQKNEQLTLTFTNDAGNPTTAQLGTFEFRDAGHYLYGTGDNPDIDDPEPNKIAVSGDGVVKIIDVASGFANLGQLFGTETGELVFNPIGGWDFDSASFGQYYIGSMEIVETSFSEVPLPAAAWLFGSALFGLVGISRRKKQA